MVHRQNEYGQLGIGTTTDESAPQLIQSLLGYNVSKIACGQHHAAAIIDGKLWTWGKGKNGQLVQYISIFEFTIPGTWPCNDKEYKTSQPEDGGTFSKQNNCLCCPWMGPLFSIDKLWRNIRFWIFQGGSSRIRMLFTTEFIH